MRNLALLAALLLFAAPVVASADSAVWSSNIPGIFFNCGAPGSAAAWYGYDCFSVLQNLNASVAYNAQAIDDTTGDDACNTTIPEGTQVDFDFTPHVSSDISWFGTGFDMDSPYGDWSVGAASPPVAYDDGNANNPPDPSEWCTEKNYLNTWGIGWGNNNSYVLLEVDPPQEQVADTDGFTCGTPGPDGSVSCTASTPGTYTPTFNFENTYGKFYYAILYGPVWPYGCVAAPLPLSVLTPQGGVFGTTLAQNPGNAYYTLQVPQQQISCPITVTSATGTPPTAPNVAAGSVAVGGNSSCTVGEPYTINFSSTDPQGEQVKYGVDWDDSGTIEEYVPSSGFVSSGTQEAASRTFAKAGVKDIRVIAIDTDGAASTWTTFATSCTGESTTTADIIEAGGTDVEDGTEGVQNYSPSLEISATPTIVKPGETSLISWSATNVTSSSCIVTGSNGDGGSGIQGWIGAISSGILSSPINQQTVYTLTCLGDNGSPLTQSTTVNIIPVFEEL
jgi:hypothetical protein